MAHPIPATPGALAHNLLEWGNGDQTARDVAGIIWPARANAYFLLESLGGIELGLCGVKPHSYNMTAFDEEIDFITAIVFGALI